MVILKLLNGTYQLTKLSLHVTPDGIVRQPLTINAPVYNESNRICSAYFYKKNKRNTWFYEEIKPKNEDTLTFA